MALDWLQPLSQPLPTQPFISTGEAYVPGAVLYGNATKLGDWFMPLSSPQPAFQLPNQAWFTYSYAPTQNIIPLVSSWFRPLSSPQPDPPFVAYRAHWQVNYATLQPQVVWLNWLQPLSSPQPSFTLPTQLIRTFVPSPPTGTPFAIRALSAHITLFGGKAVLTNTPEVLPNFNWEVAWSFPTINSPFLDVCAYDPTSFTIFVQYLAGNGSLYSPTSAFQALTLARLVQQGQDPTVYLSGLPILDL